MHRWHDKMLSGKLFLRQMSHVGCGNKKTRQRTRFVPARLSRDSRAGLGAKEISLLRTLVMFSVIYAWVSWPPDCSCMTWYATGGSSLEAAIYAASHYLRRRSTLVSPQLHKRQINGCHTPRANAVPILLASSCKHLTGADVAAQHRRTLATPRNENRASTVSLIQISNSNFVGRPGWEGGILRQIGGGGVSDLTRCISRSRLRTAQHTA